MLTPENSAIALIDYQPAMYQGVQSHDRLTTFNNILILAKAAKLFKIPTVIQYVFELQQDWARSETYEGVMDILRAHSPYGIQVRFSKWALGEHASEAGLKVA